MLAKDNASADIPPFYLLFIILRTSHTKEKTNPVQACSRFLIYQNHNRNAKNKNKTKKLYIM